MNWQVLFYEKEGGEKPVLNYLQSLDAKMRAKVFSEIELLKKNGRNLREPYVRAICGEKKRAL